MDVTRYTNATVLCRRLAGRLSDVVLESVRVYYFVGEDGLADDTLLVNLVIEEVQIDPAERDLLRAVVGDPNAPEIDRLRVVDKPASRTHDFRRTAPPSAPDPSRADDLLATEAERQRVHGLYRTWRSSADSAEAGTWLYVALVDDTADELRVHSALSSMLGTALGLAWPIEVTTAQGEPHSYQHRALAGAVLVAGEDAS
ncbi:hypothetical protein [Nonomuraea sp. NPDC003214]